VAYNEELAKQIRARLEKHRTLKEKKMFGGVGSLVNGNMACGVHKQDLIVRLSERDFGAALKQANVRIFDMTGRPMKGWIMVSADGYRSEKALDGWIQKGMAFARSLPAK
jgi:TfoX/Sxy family transcriptional regulator of competence genes